MSSGRTRSCSLHIVIEVTKRTELLRSTVEERTRAKYKVHNFEIAISRPN